MSETKTTDLFRFVTLRSPQTITEVRRDLGFVDHHDPANSYFLTRIESGEPLSVNRTAMANAATTFTPFTGVSDVKALSSEFWEFSLWLSENRNTLVRDDIDALIPTDIPTSAEFVSMWDNVFYDILTKDNPYIREACLKMIIAKYFVDHYATYSPNTDPNLAEAELALITRLANAKVIINEVFTATQSPTNSTNTNVGSAFSSQHTRYHESRLNSLRVPVLEAIRDELLDHEKTYQQDFDTAYDAAYSTYKTQAQSDVDAFLAANPDIEATKIAVTKTAYTEKDGDAGKFQLTEESTGNETANIEDLIPEDVTTSFSFSYDDPLSDTYAQPKLSQAALDFVEAKALKEAPVKDAVKAVEDIRESTERSRKICI